MAGHSKWANMKHRKARADKKKGKIFSRITKEIISAVRQGGSDPKANTKLRLALQKAKDANMPNENVERNIKKASSADQQDYFEMAYELYGHGGVGIIAEIMTDNKNRISSDMHIATKEHGGNVAKQGAVSHNFDRKGEFHLPKSQINEEELFFLVTEAGGEDLITEEDAFIVRTSVEGFNRVKEALENRGYAYEEAKLVMVPRDWIEVNEEQVDSNMALLEYLEDLEDVDTVYHNMKL
jgi:YebC/PmpR family DNA-binding regulatory protein